VAAKSLRFLVPYGTILCVSIERLHEEAGRYDKCLRGKINRHLSIGTETVRLLREQGVDRLHSRKSPRRRRACHPSGGRLLTRAVPVRTIWRSCVGKSASVVLIIKGSLQGAVVAQPYRSNLTPIQFDDPSLMAPSIAKQMAVMDSAMLPVLTLSPLAEKAAHLRLQPESAGA
jgi:hypothetical protein